MNKYIHGNTPHQQRMINSLVKHLSFVIRETKGKSQFSALMLATLVMHDGEIHNFRITLNSLLLSYSFKKDELSADERIMFTGAEELLKLQ